MQRRLLACLFVSGILLAAWRAGAQDCPGAPPTRLAVGIQAQVIPGLTNNLRANPSATDERIGQLPGGVIFVIIAGPVCADNFNWWQVDYGGLNGWTVEGSGSEYYLQPAAALPAEVTATLAETIATLVPETPAGTPGTPGTPGPSNTPRPTARPTIVLTPTAPPLPVENIVNATPQIGGRARIFIRAQEGLTVHTDADVEGEAVGSLPSGTMIDVLSGPLLVNNLNWWQVRDTNGLEGWIPEQIVDQAGFTAHTLIPVCPFTTGRIAFGADNIYTADSDGANLCNLTQDFGEKTYTEVVWSPDGARLAFILKTDFFNTEIEIVDADGSNLWMIMPPDSNYSFLSWSPDGTQLSFLREQENDFFNQIWVVNVEGKNAQPITTDQTRKRTARWSPDGKWIAFSEIIPDFDQVAVISSDGSTLQTILPTLDNPALDLDWSPDGLQMAISMFGEGIYGINAAGDEKRLLMGGDFLAPVNAPAWSPDGRMIAYWETAKTSQKDGGVSIRNLMVMSAEGSGRRLLVPQVAVPLGGVFTLVFPPVWSPDGTNLAYASMTDGVSVVEASSGLVTAIYQGRTSANPVWQPRG
ncbi:MAG: hypothetical protein K8L97_31955 [Anaerolineae bacterium]|nr:hypothetical protein [Anaerolineae bacterium]